MNNKETVDSDLCGTLGSDPTWTALKVFGKRRTLKSKVSHFFLLIRTIINIFNPLAKTIH